ncbi:MAG: hypothetical protein ACOY4Q_10495 [Bacillota bacterium]
MILEELVKEALIFRLETTGRWLEYLQSKNGRILTDPRETIIDSVADFTTLEEIARELHLNPTPENLNKLFDAIARIRDDMIA